jgi:hypothetical protein
LKKTFGRKCKYLEKIIDFEEKDYLTIKMKNYVKNIE